ncbi:uncharacterized protein LOC9656142 [Selaginella moellendorffii]|uniref:uncharacterized protein LOC9656142 n=1 Tax=Selaginella moellendorffii TaxID=88036 RepID=UPI000D1C52D1|nr:uncharacterized protein LOC9656142 [Selaginella moellendorffii]|eukprot:XP_024538284.1 uncharacterized protein LOC9656142 [Selaginella moellendorffii]
MLAATSGEEPGLLATKSWMLHSGVLDRSWRISPPPRRLSCRCYFNPNATRNVAFQSRDSQQSRYGILEGAGYSKDDAVQRTMRKFYEGRNGPPLRILPIGGLGEIGMNCMLVGHYDRYIMIDAGLMFPDYEDFGVVKVLPDTTFISRWKHKIEAVIITHGHEDHIGALPWVIPALDPQTRIYSTSFTLELIKRRLKDYNFPFEHRCHTFTMRNPFQAGPFKVEAIRVTHSIPDCCGLILRCQDGTIFHSGDWKIDENPLDGKIFDRNTLEELGKEGVTLMMSDSTNVLSPGRTISETDVRKSLMQYVTEAKSRVISTQFASNIHRLGSMKAAADASGRKLVFIGTALKTYIDAAWKDGQAPFDPSILVKAEDMGAYSPKDLLIVTTGSQGETRSALNLASFGSSRSLKLSKDDVILYSAKMIPGNETRVMKMLNRISEAGPHIITGKDKLLHTSGHAYRDELQELLRLIRPQHFLPVHGEYTFLKEHEQLGRASGIQHTKVIRNGEMLGVSPLRNRRVLSSGFAALGKEDLQLMYNDGEKAFGTASDLRVDERKHIAFDGIIIVSIEVIRDALLEDDDNYASRLDGSEYGLRARIRITTRCLWLDQGKLTEALHRAANAAVGSCKQDADLQTVERTVATVLRKVAQKYNNKRPEVVAIATERAVAPKDKLIQKRLVVDAAAQLKVLVRTNAVNTRVYEKEKRQQQHAEKDNERRLSVLTPEFNKFMEKIDKTEDAEPVIKVPKVEETETEEERVRKAIAEKVLREMKNARTQKAARIEEEKKLQRDDADETPAPAPATKVEERKEEKNEVFSIAEKEADLAATGKSRWKPEATQVLIRLRTGMDDKFREAKLKTPLWKEIASKLAEHGYEHTHGQCKAMWSTLVKRYRNIIDDDGSSNKNWPFFDGMHAYLSDDPDS